MNPKQSEKRLKWRCCALLEPYETDPAGQKQCRELFTSWAAAERHADAHTNDFGAHGARLECVIE